MKEHIQKLAELWPKYRKKELEDKTQEAYKLIYDVLPKALKKWNIGKQNLVVGSSGGTGRITNGPWFASFDSRITTEPQKGYYLVFLFSLDMKKIILELGFATTQFTMFYGDNKKTRNIMRESAIRMQKKMVHICSDFPDQRFINKLDKGESNLCTKDENKLQKGYEKASIFHISYEIQTLDELTLRHDYERFIELYQNIVSSGDALNVAELLEESIVVQDIVDKFNNIQAKVFAPRSPKATGMGSNGKTGQSKPKAGESTKKIGDLGELIVLKYEQEKLIKLKLDNLVKKIVHEEAVNNRPGWDISSFDENGKPIQIEVKASKGKAINNIIFTANELTAAQHYGESYYIYLVSDVSGKKAPDIEVLQNPFKMIQTAELQIRTIAYEIKLYAKLSEH